MIARVTAGAWGHGSFENDSAHDWIFEIQEADISNGVFRTLSDVSKYEYLEVDICSHAIAAAEVIASLKKDDFSNLPEPLSKWAQENKVEFKPNMSKLAMNAIELCKNVGRSELAQLWSEGDSSAWRTSIKKLEDSLK